MQTWEANVRRVVPYTPGEQPDHQDMIKLNTNENPYPPAPGVCKALSGIEPESLRLYPDPAADDLVKAIAEACGVKKQQVFVGVGSDAVSYTHLFCEGELTGEFMQEDATQEKLLQSATR